MKATYDKNDFKVSNEEIKGVRGIKNTLKALKLVKTNYHIVIGIIITFIISVGSAIISALVVKNILLIVTTGRFDECLVYAFVFLMLNIVDYINFYYKEYFWDVFNRDLKLNLQLKAYNQINSLKAQCFSETQTASFTRRINEADKISTFFTTIANQLQDLFHFLAYSIVLLFSSPILFGICAIFYFIKNIFYSYLLPRRKALNKRHSALYDKVSNISIESIRGATDVKGLNFEKPLADNYKSGMNDYASKKINMGIWWRNRIMPVNFFAFTLSTVTLLLTLYFFNSYFSIATIIFFWTYKGNINGLFNILFNFQENFSNIEVSSSRYMELYDEKLYSTEKFGQKVLENFVGDIKFKNVYFSYEKGKTILSNVSFEVEPNKITAFVGKTGCGKSTTLALISRFYDPTKGKITIDEINSKELTKDCLRSNISYVQQSPYIFNRSFKENLLLVNPEATDKEIETACKKAELHSFIKTTKNGYDTIIGENGITLSGGQKQRLAIARALINKSKIIMFDESTSSLDNENQSKIQATIEKLSKDHTIIVVAHRLSTIINADKIIYIEDHKIKATGTHDELFSNCKEYRELYEVENKAKSEEA